MAMRSEGDGTERLHEGVLAAADVAGRLGDALDDAEGWWEDGGDPKRRVYVHPLAGGRQECLRVVPPGHAHDTAYPVAGHGGGHAGPDRARARAQCEAGRDAAGGPAWMGARVVVEVAGDPEATEAGAGGVLRSFAAGEPVPHRPDGGPTTASAGLMAALGRAAAWAEAWNAMAEDAARAGQGGSLAFGRRWRCDRTGALVHDVSLTPAEGMEHMEGDWYELRIRGVHMGRAWRRPDGSEEREEGGLEWSSWLDEDVFGQLSDLTAESAQGLAEKVMDLMRCSPEWP